MPTIRERLDADLKDAMRSKEELKLSVIRMAKSAIKYKEVEDTNKVLDEDGILSVLTSMLKQRRDSIEQYRAGGRNDLAEKEEKELAIIQAYLPAQLSAEQLAAEVRQAIAEVKATGPKDMGQVMKVVTPKLKGKAEGKHISEEVKSQLQKLTAS
jgi:uncharacterized protein YqeY